MVAGFIKIKLYFSEENHFEALIMGSKGCSLRNRISLQKFSRKYRNVYPVKKCLTKYRILFPVQKFHRKHGIVFQVQASPFKYRMVLLQFFIYISSKCVMLHFKYRRQFQVQASNFKYRNQLTSTYIKFQVPKSTSSRPESRISEISLRKRFSSQDSSREV